MALSEDLVRVLLGLDAKKGEEEADSDNNANTYTTLLILDSKERMGLHLACYYKDSNLNLMIVELLALLCPEECAVENAGAGRSSLLAAL